MVRLAAGLVGTYFVAFAATSFVVAEADAPASVPSPTAVQKGDRLPGAGAAAVSPRSVAEVEVLAGEAVSVIVRDADGREVLRVDNAANTTIVARDATIPRLRLHSEALEVPLPPRREAPMPARLPTEEAEEERPEERIFACESGLSALADDRAASLPRICLAAAAPASPEYSDDRGL